MLVIVRTTHDQSFGFSFSFPFLVQCDMRRATNSINTSYECTCGLVGGHVPVCSVILTRGSSRGMNKNTPRRRAYLLIDVRILDFLDSPLTCSTEYRTFTHN